MLKYQQPAKHWDRSVDSVVAPNYKEGVISETGNLNLMQNTSTGEKMPGKRRKFCTGSQLLIVSLIIKVSTPRHVQGCTPSHTGAVVRAGKQNKRGVGFPLRERKIRRFIYVLFCFVLTQFIPAARFPRVQTPVCTNNDKSPAERHGWCSQFHV